MKRERVPVSVNSAAFREVMRRMEEKKQDSKQKKRVDKKPERFQTPVQLWNGAWSNRRCFIVGGGSSLTGFDFSRLDNDLVIAVNAAYIDTNPDIIFGMDRRFFQWANSGTFGDEALSKWKNTKALKVRLIMNDGDYGDMIKLKCMGTDGLSENLEHGLFHGKNSGYGALNLAYCLGANPIYLLGFDMDNYNRKNYHDHYIPGNMKEFPDAFENNKNKILAKTKVINLNPDSNLKCFEFGDFKDLEFKKKEIEIIEDNETIIHKDVGYNRDWVLVSLYTRDTPYEQEVENLKRSLKWQKINSCIFGEPAMGSWRRNLDHKSNVILKAMKMFPDKDIVFVDADAIVKENPVLFDKLSNEKKYHIAPCYHEYRNSIEGGSLLSGTLWIRNNARGKEIVTKWHKIGTNRTEIRHQHCLTLALQEKNKVEERIKIFRLPIEYTFIFDYSYKRRIERPVIIHYQAHRKFRSKMGDVKLLDSDFTIDSEVYKNGV